MDPNMQSKDVDAALFALQSDPPRLVKDQDGQVGNQKTKYADLIQANAVILPRLSMLGLLWITSPTLRMIDGPNGQQDPRFVLDWEMKHIPSGTSRKGTYPLPAGANPMQNGSAITYARRYALLAITNTVAEDDDDDGAGYGRRGMAGRATARAAANSQTVQRAGGATERARPPQQPPLPARETSARPGMITDPMTRKLAVTMADCGLTGDARLPFVIDLVGRQVTSSKELSFAEGRALIDAFEAAKGSEDPQSAAIEAYRTGMPTPEGDGQ
jgi:hypothetical protein